MAKTNALTLAIIKRDAIDNGVAAGIMNKLLEGGFMSITPLVYTSPSAEIIEEFYADHKDKSYFPDLAYSLSHCCPMLLTYNSSDRRAAIPTLRNLIGPTVSRNAPMDTIRGMFGGHRFRDDAPVAANAIHASDSSTSLIREIKTLRMFGLMYFEYTFVDMNFLKIPEVNPDDCWVEY